MKKAILILTLLFLISCVYSQNDIECKKEITELKLKIETLKNKVKVLEKQLKNQTRDSDLNINSGSVNYLKTKKKRNKSGRVYHRGPRGGCYYYNSRGNKQYVPRSLCN
jgi:hypothetical protein